MIGKLQIFKIDQIVIGARINASEKEQPVPSFMLASDFNSLLLLATSLAFFGRCKNLSALTLL